MYLSKIHKLVFIFSDLVCERHSGPPAHRQHTVSVWNKQHKYINKGRKLYFQCFRWWDSPTIYILDVQRWALWHISNKFWNCVGFNTHVLTALPVCVLMGCEKGNRGVVVQSQDILHIQSAQSRTMSECLDHEQRVDRQTGKYFLAWVDKDYSLLVSVLPPM